MRSLGYLVLDETGLVINAIAIDDPYPDNYWPGSGRYITCAFGEPDPTPPSNLNLRPGDMPPLTYLTVRPTSRCWIGDTMNVETGAVTPAPLPDPAPEEVSE